MNTLTRLSKKSVAVQGGELLSLSGLTVPDAGSFSQADELRRSMRAVGDVARDDGTSNDEDDLSLALDRLVDDEFTFDPQAKQEYWKELNKIKHAAEEAKQLGNSEKLVSLEQEASQIVDHIKRNTAPSGQPRPLGLDRHLALKRAHGQLTTAFQRLQLDFPELVAHLKKCLRRRSGSYNYKPDISDMAWRT